MICIRNFLNIGGIWCWFFSLGYYAKKSEVASQLKFGFLHIQF